MLVLSLILVALVAGLAFSFYESGQALRDEARAGRTGLAAELAAESGLDYSLRRLALDSAWTGNAEDGTAVGAASFLVERLDVPDPEAGLVAANLVVTGLAGAGRCRLALVAEVATSDLLRHQALAALGGVLDLRNVNVYGNLALSDAPGGVYDWVADGAGGGAWSLAADEIDQDFAFSSTEVSGTLFKQSELPYLGTGNEQQTSLPLMMPSWTLEPYLAADPRIRIFDHVTSVSNLVLEETAVFLLDPGQILVLDDTELRGGAIVYAPADQDLRGEARNTIVLKHVNLIGGGAGGIHPNVGLIAPATRVTDETGLVNSFNGFSFWHTLDNVNRIEIVGQIVVVNDAVLNVADITFDPAVAVAPPLGVAYAGPPPGATLTAVRELFDE